MSSNKSKKEDNSDLVLSSFSSNTDITVDTPNFNCSGSISCGDGATGTFTSADGKTITVTNGIITDIE